MTAEALIEDILNKYNQDDKGRILFSNHSLQSNRVCELIAGVDEAGRGPVLGPMVYCIFYCAPKFENDLKEIKCNDSKSMTDQKRKVIFDWICQRSSECGFVLNIIPPKFISTSMLAWQKYDLNTMSHDTVVRLIDYAQEATKNSINKIFIDTVGPEKTYHTYLESRMTFKRTSLCVSSKADSKYLVVGAASICAKVVRDTILEKLLVRYNHSSNYGLDIGSGYPSDPKTIAWIASIDNPLSGFPDYLVRFSWKTIQTILEKKLYIKWPVNVKLVKNKRKSPNEPECRLSSNPLLTQFNLSYAVDWDKF